MIRKDTDIRAGLAALGLGHDEATVYLALLRSPATPLVLSRDTGIKRTKIYHLIETLEKRSLIARHTDDRGSFFVVTQPSNLGIDLDAREARLQDERHMLHQILPMLTALQGGDHQTPFAVRVYEGLEGFKQMAWHELKTKGELLSFGGGDLEEIVPDPRWSERHRDRTVGAGYRVREILNSEVDLPTFIGNQEYLQRYSCRGISARIVPLDNQIIIYNDTVAMYSWRQPKKVGVEILSPTLAATMRGIFETYWKLAEPATSRSD